MRAGQIKWLWYCLGVLLASCTSGSITVSSTPTLAFLRVTWLPPTPTPVLRLLRTSTSAVTPVILAPTLLPLPIAPPDCYETAVGSLWCLGLIKNSLTTPIADVRVQVYLVTKDGLPLSNHETTIARRFLAPGESSPYGILFDSVPEGYAGPVVLLQNAAASNANLISLQIKNAQGELQESLYHVTGMLLNSDKSTVKQLNLVVTVFDGRGRVTGFKQYRWPDNQTLAPGELLPFTVNVTPQGLGTARFEASAEGTSQ